MALIGLIDYIFESIINATLYAKNIDKYLDYSLLCKDVELINISNLKKIKVINTSQGFNFNVYSVEYEGKQYAFKQFKKNIFKENDRLETIFSSVAGLSKGYEMFPDLFPEVKGFVISENYSELSEDEVKYEGLLVEYFGEEYKQLRDYELGLKDETIERIEDTVESMQTSWVWCDVHMENILIDSDQNIKFIDCNLNLPFLSCYKLDWDNIKYIKLRKTENHNYTKTINEWKKQIQQTYKTVLTCTFDERTWWFKDKVTK